MSARVRSPGSSHHVQPVGIVVESGGCASLGPGAGGRGRCCENPVAAGWGTAGSRRRVIRGQWGCLVGQVSGEEGELFVEK